MEIETLVQQAYNDYHEGVVLITKRKPGKDKPARSTGFVIGRAGTSYLIMTCAHCITYSDRIQPEVEILVNIPSEINEYVAEVLYHDASSDLAIVKVIGVSKELPVLPFGDTTDAARNTSVVQLGYVMHSRKFPTMYPATSPGKITAPVHQRRWPNEDIIDVVCDTNAKKGTSGSPILLDRKVIGVLYAMEMRTHVNLVRSTDTICQIMRDWLQTPPTCVLTITEMIEEIKQKLAVGPQDV